jgi:uncharacterized membrane protein YphA (DoxX/SURF4 family)
MQNDSENREGRQKSLKPLFQTIRRYLTYAGNVLQHRYLTLGTRIVLGGMFLVAGIAQLVQLDRFVSLAKLVNAIPFYTFAELYDITPSEQFVTIGMLPDTLVRAYATYLPAVEVIIGITLLAGILLRFSSSISILMLISFIVAKIVTTSHGYELPFGDFSLPEYIYGGLAVWLIRLSMAVDFVLVAFAFQIILHKDDFLALGNRFREQLRYKRAIEEPPS